MKHLLPALRRLAVGALLVFLGILARPVHGQSSEDQSTYASQKKLTVSVTQFAPAKDATNAFLRRRRARVLSQQETPEQLIAEFSLPVQSLPALDSLAATIGFVIENNLNARNTDQRVQELRDQQADTRATIYRLQSQLRDLLAVPKVDSSQVRAQRSQLSNYATTLRRTTQQLAVFDAHDSLAYVTLRVFDEVTFPTANRSVKFVNMPGVEIGLLRLENPQAGLSAQYYQGYSVKYLFTRGKSYFNLGIYKPTTKAAATDSSFVSELFLINFGQDFYPRHFGRGQRKFLNLYTTYQVGGVILNRQGEDTEAQFIPNVNLGIGLELLKTKNILFDTKASYFLPLHHLNRDLRGLLLQGSFSFVF
jgi:hypothetical protein